MGSTLLTAAVLATAALVLTACGLVPEPDRPPQACTGIGCESAVAFNLSVDLEPGVEYRVEACLDDRCATETIAVPDADDEPGATGRRVGQIDLSTADDRILLVLPEDDYGGEHRASLRVVTTADDELNVAAEEVTAFERQQPNGPGCPPVCWFAEVLV